MTDRPSTASSSASATVRYPGSPSTAAPGKRAARSSTTGPKQPGQGDRARAVRTRSSSLTQLVIRTLRLNLQNTSAIGSYSVRTDDVGTTSRAPSPRSMSSRSRKARRSHACPASRRVARGGRAARVALRRHPASRGGQGRWCRRRCQARRRAPRGSAAGTGPLLPARKAASHAGRRRGPWARDGTGARRQAPARLTGTGQDGSAGRCASCSWPPALVAVACLAAGSR